MKIWFQHIAPFKEVWRTYDDILKNHTKKMFPDMVIDHYWVEDGLPGVEYKIFDPYNVLDAFRKIMEAQEKGYDATVICCSMDIGLREIRQVVNIPIAGLAESAMLCACLLGQRFSYITINKMLQLRLEELIRIYGLENRAVSVRSFEMTLEEVGKALDQPESVKRSFMEEAKKAVEQGAEVILCGCGLLDALCIREGINKIEGAPVVDSMVASINMARTLIDLKKVGVSVSRVGIYRSPTTEEIEEAKRLYGLK